MIVNNLNNHDRKDNSQQQPTAQQQNKHIKYQNHHNNQIKDYNLWQQIGSRVADQYNDRIASKLNPAQNVKAFIKGIVKSFLGVDIDLSSQNIQFLKRQHLYDLQYTIKQNHFADFVLLPQKMFDSVQERQNFNYLAILTGFICGALQTMNFTAKVTVQKDALQQVPESSKNVDPSMIFSKNETTIRIKLDKQIKNDD